MDNSTVRIWSAGDHLSEFQRKSISVIEVTNYIGFLVPFKISRHIRPSLSAMTLNTKWNQKVLHVPIFG